MKKWTPFAVVFLLSILLTGCGGAPPKATPTATPTPSPRQFLEKASVRMAALKSVSFSLEHEAGVTPLLPGVSLRAVEGRAALPDRFQLKAKAVAGFIGASLEINVIAVGEEASMTDPITGAWRRVPMGTLPFDFRDLGRTLSSIVASLQDPAFAGEERIGDSRTRRIRGTVSSDSLRTLVPGAVGGLTVGLELWIEEEEGLLLRARIAGRVVLDDEPQVVRLLTLHSFDKPVDLAPPPGAP